MPAVAVGDLCENVTRTSRDTLSLLACLGYIVVFGGIGIRWFQWDAR
jgi:ABC-2 type transport system permease protein